MSTPHTAAELLLNFLDMAVPLEMQRLAHLDEASRLRIGHEAAHVIPEKGDVIQFRATGTAAATAALIRGLAAAAYQPGGVVFAGRHWCTDHTTCEVAS